MEEKSWRRSRSRKRDAGGVEEETHMGEIIELDRGCCCLLTGRRWVLRCVGVVVIGPKNIGKYHSGDRMRPAG